MIIDSPIGTISIRADDVVRMIRIGETDQSAAASATPLEQRVAEQLNEYFSAARTAFDLPLAAEGSELHRRVWTYLDGIKFGTAVSYGHIARELGLEPAAARAVGGAVGANPVLIVRPCHRVLGADGSLTGYAGGLDAKLWLLQHVGVLL